jgi:hypothetical protein
VEAEEGPPRDENKHHRSLFEIRSLINRFIYTFWEEIDPDGQYIRRVDTGPIALHCIYHHEVVHLLASTGLNVEHVYEDFFGYALNDESDQIIGWRRKLRR